MIRNPPLDTVRAACAHLLGPCCFLPSCPLLPSLAPLAAAGLRLLSPFSSLFTLRLSWPATQSFSEVVFFDLLFWPLVVVCLVLSGLSSCFVGVFCCCACCQPTEVTKDCRVLPAPSVHTHTRHRDFLPPRVSFRGWLVLEFVCFLFVLAVL